MINKVVFIVSTPLYLRDYDRFGAAILIKNGFEVEFLNIAPYVYPELFVNATKKKLYTGDRQKILSSKSEFYRKIKSVDSDSFVVLIINYNRNTYHVFRGVSKLNLPYAVSVLNYVPTSVSKSSKSTLFSKLKKIKPKSYFKAVINKLYSARFSKFMGVNAPNALLMGGEMCMSHPLFLLSDRKTSVLWLHTFDYDIYLQHKKYPDQAVSKKAVFIDAPSPRFKFDALVPGISSPLTEARYYPALCSFFDCLERMYDVEVEIAAHPKSEHDLSPDYFGNRLVHSNKIASMIRDSKVVINRNSTSVNFVVLYKKPVIFHLSDEIKSSSPMFNQIKSMASSLGKIPVNIDRLGDVDWKKEIEIEIDEEAYCRYKNSYIKKDGTRDVPIWQSFSNWLKMEY